MARRRCRLRTSTAARGLRFNRAFPEAMVTIPARRSIFTSRRIFPYRNFVPNPELGSSPGWLPIEGDENTFTKAPQSEGYWAVQVSDNPHSPSLKAYEPFRKTFDNWRTIVGQSGFYRRSRASRWSWWTSGCRRSCATSCYVPGMRKYLANTGRGEDEEQTCAARVHQGRRRHPRKGPAAPALRDGGRQLRPARTVESPAEYIDMYSDAGPDVQNIGVTATPRRIHLELLRRLHAIYAAEVTMTDRWLGHFMDRFYELGLDENTVIVLLSDHGYLLGERGYTGKVSSQLHPELAQVPFIFVTPDDKAAGKTSSTSPRPTTSARRCCRCSGSIRRVDGGHRLRGCSTASSRPRSARSTTAACTTASTSAATTTC